MSARPYLPGVPAAGHVTGGGHWHPGRIDGCVKCAPPADELLDYRAISAMTGLSVATLRGYCAAGRMPKADALPVPDRPRWRRSTISAWLDARPGRGAPGQPRVRRPQR